MVPAMSKSLVADAFAHHVWATLRLIDVCLGLTPQQLETEVRGIYGSILTTLRHLVGADSLYLSVVSRERIPRVPVGEVGLAELRAGIERNGIAWARVIGEELDPDNVLVGWWGDGFELHAPVGIRLAQALHHGTDHRSQICTALASFGVKPPDIDVWDFGTQEGRVVEVPATS